MKTATKLLQWYEKEKRDLPWRETIDPYKILVSEIMLQQTQVDRVINFYKNWLKQFPDFSALAKATNADVIHAWSGLGYNRRALALRDIAKQVIDDGLPKTQKEWVQLKGIGPYTSSAIALFSAHEKVFPIDSIIRRVIGRYSLGKLFPDFSDDEKIQKSGLQLLSESKEYYDIPQALFDLGTKVCSKKPSCSVCPLKTTCKSSKRFLSGNVLIPKRSLPKAKEKIHMGKKYPDRIYRGKVLQCVKNNKAGVTRKEIEAISGLFYESKQDKQWLDHLLARLIKDGLILYKKRKYLLPGS